MNAFGLELLARYWSLQEVVTNLLVFANIFGALLLGLVVGYERTYHGRAAGMRTYGLVCMASCALVVVVGYPSFWYGGGNPGSIRHPGAADRSGAQARGQLARGQLIVIANKKRASLAEARFV